MLVSKINVCSPQAKKIWKFCSKIVKFAHFGVSESGVRTAFQVLAKLVLTPGPEQVLACVQHLAHLSVSIPVPTPFKRWNRTPRRSVRSVVCRCRIRCVSYRHGCEPNTRHVLALCVFQLVSTCQDSMYDDGYHLGAKPVSVCLRTSLDTLLSNESHYFGIT